MSSNSSLNSLKEINSLDTFDKFISSVEPIIGNAGGRKFAVKRSKDGDKNFQADITMNAIVNKFEKIMNDKSLEKNPEQIDEVILKILNLDKKANDLLKVKSNGLYGGHRMLTRIRQFFGNAFYNLFHTNRQDVIQRVIYENESQQRIKAALKTVIDVSNLVSEEPPESDLALIELSEKEILESEYREVVTDVNKYFEYIEKAREQLVNTDMEVVNYVPIFQKLTENYSRVQEEIEAPEKDLHGRISKYETIGADYAKFIKQKTIFYQYLNQSKERIITEAQKNLIKVAISDIGRDLPTSGTNSLKELEDLKNEKDHLVMLSKIKQMLGLATASSMGGGLTLETEIEKFETLLKMKN